MPAEEAAASGGSEFEVEDILKYRRNEDGEEYFLVKWVGYSASEATWEPLKHMNDNCRELIAKARALFAWQRSPALVAAAEPTFPLASLDTSGEGLEVREEDDSPHGAEPSADDSVAPPQPQALAATSVAALAAVAGGQVTADDEDNITIEDADTEVSEDEDAPARPQPGEAKRPADASATGQALKRPRLEPTPVPPQRPPGAWGAAVPSQSKRAALLLSGTTPSANGAARQAAGSAAAAQPAPSVRQVSPAQCAASPPGPVPPTMPPPRQGEPPKPPSREIKCICGTSDKLSGNSRSSLVVCRVCNCSLHTSCVEGAVHGSTPSVYVCPTCRLERVDEFHPPIGGGLLRHGYASSSSTFTLNFNAQATQWKKQQWAVHLRAVLLMSGDLGGPAWPHRVQGKLNGKPCVAIDPPKHLHVRREQCYNLTPLLRQGPNTLEMRFTPRPDRPRDEPEENYCVGVVLTRPRTVASIIARIKSRSTETLQSGKLRVQRLLAQVACHEAQQEDECKVTGTFGRTLRPLCPVSHCPIEEAAIGRHCNHVQVFDLQAYIAVNQRMRSLDKRWTCPVCSLSLRPDDLVLDPFAQEILETLRGEEELVDSVVFNDDCSWSRVSAVKDEKERQPGEDEGHGESALATALIDLSDDE